MFKIFQRVHNNNKPKITLGGIDYALYSKARKTIEKDESPLSDLGFITNALTVYEAFLVQTEEKNGKFNKKWTGSNKLFPVIDFPSFNNNHITFQIAYNEDTVQRIEKMKRLSHLKSSAAVVKQAVIFFSNLVIERNNGWTHLQSSPDDPKGGIPIFTEDFEQNEQSIDEVIQLDEWSLKGGRKKVASAIRGLTPSNK